MYCSVCHSGPGDGCKSTDNMTFSLTNDGQEGHYYELLSTLSAGVTLWLFKDVDVFWRGKKKLKSSGRNHVFLVFVFFSEVARKNILKEMKKIKNRRGWRKQRKMGYGEMRGQKM